LGSTFARLHRDWQVGLGIWDALTAGRHLNILAIACILATLTAIDGPLLQRVSNVTMLVLNNPIQLSVSLTCELPANATRYFDFSNSTLFSDDSTQAAFFPPFIQVYLDYAQAKPMTGAITGCPGTCKLIWL
jgi:hypothetical protein